MPEKLFTGIINPDIICQYISVILSGEKFPASLSAGKQNNREEIVMQESRLFKILYYLLDKGGATAPELAKKFEVSVRTIYRDIDALSGAGIPVYAEAGRTGGIRIMNDFIIDKAVFSEEEKQEILTAFSKEYGCKFHSFPYPKQTKTRAFIKIQDGCNNFCSYCIIPYLRGREVSRPIDDILAEISATECPEIVLNGINISSYEGGLDKLIIALKDIKKRVRLGSLECSVISDGLLTALKNLYDFAPQFHLSLQSGSTAVLKAMNRHYTREQYIEKCKKIYSCFPDAAITTDIIAGFATETEEDFKESLSIIEEVGFARVHAFAYSPREGTVSYKWKDIPPEIKSERLHRLIAAGEESAKKFAEKFFGRIREFIAEEYSEGFTCGYTDNYIRVYVSGNVKTGIKYRVKLLKGFKDGVIAEIYG